MSLKAKPLETRVDILEEKVERLEYLEVAVKKIAEVTDRTHHVLLEHQRETRERFAQHDQRFEQQDRRADEQDKKFNALLHAVYAGFKRSDERFEEITAEMREGFRQTAEGFKETNERVDQLELLIRQRIPNSTN